jgi:hypothetical protein
MLKNQNLNLLFVPLFSLGVSMISRAQTLNTNTLSTTTIKGNMTVDSVAIINDTLKAREDVVAEQDVKIFGDLLFKNNKGFQYYPSINGKPEIYTLGKTPGGPPPVISQCLSGLPTQPAWVFAPGPQIQLSGYSGTYPNVLSVGLDGANGFIDLAGVGASGSPNNSLLINYYCGKNVAICTGVGGGEVSVGGRFYAQNKVHIGQNWVPIDQNVQLNVFEDQSTQLLKLNKGANTLKLIGSNDDKFIVYPNGSIHSEGGLQIGFPAQQSSIQDPYAALNINAVSKGGISSTTQHGSATYGYNIKSIVDNTTTKAFVSVNSVSNKEVFTVYGSGQTYIRVNPSFGNALNIEDNLTGQVRTIFYANGSAHFEKSIQIGFPSNQLNIQDNSYLLNLNTNVSPTASNGIKFKTSNSATRLVYLDNTAPGAGFTIMGNGQTIIGSRKPLNTGAHWDAMLSVYGKILAKSIYVSVSNGVWADYVFKSDYKLMPLKTLEDYLKTESHLPNVPSTIEVEKNGVNLVENDAKLLEKLEEAYLYIIQLNKRIEDLERKVK